MISYWKTLKDIKTYKKPFHVLRFLAAIAKLKLEPKKHIIAVTGSVGKTTTTQAIAFVFGQNAIATLPNLDTIFNLPITILKSKKNTPYLVLEMGVQYPNDMDINISIAQPEMAIFTRISPAHTLYLQNPEKIFEEKSKIITPKTKVVIYNRDDSILAKNLKNIKIKKISIGFNAHSDYQITQVSESVDQTSFVLKTSQKSYKLHTQLIGKHQIFSIAVAFAAARYYKMPTPKIITRLAGFHPPLNRFNIQKINGNTVIKDFYNASPQAMFEAIDFISRQKFSNKIVILGDMLELGKDEKQFHLSLAKQIQKSDMNIVYTYGPLSKNISDYLSKFAPKISISHLDKPFNIKTKTFPPNSIILVKGSHGMHMEDFF